MKIRTLIAAAGLLAAALASQAQNLVTNGNFEADLLPTGTSGVYNSLTGWTGVSEIKLVNKAPSFVNNYGNYVELDTGANMSMYQDFQGGGLAYLSFTYISKTGSASEAIKFRLENLTDEVFSTVGPNRYYGVVDLGTYGTHRLTFSAAGAADSMSGGLDNVSVTAIPEPETYALMLAGLGSIGAAVRRRRQLST